MAANKAARNTTQTYARADEEDIRLHKAPNRVNFGSIKEPIDVPYLLGVQTDSFDWLIGNERWKQRVEEDKQAGTNTVAHTSGLDEVFQEISPIENFAQTMSLAFSDPYFEEPRHTVLECKEKDYTYSAPLYVNAEFENGDTGEIKSQTVFMGDFPLQTPHGTFIIGGTERVIVSQLVRSPGVYFDRNRDRTTDKEVFGAKIIPSRGAWLEFEIDKRDVLGVRVDRKRKQSAIVFLEAIGMTKSEIKESFQGYPLVLDALEKESIDNQDAALTDLYRKIRPSDTATPEAGRNLLDSFYFNTKRYDLARVGRYKINRKLGLEADFDDRSLNRDDIIATIKYLVTLHAGDKTFPGSRNGEAVDLRVDVDDIDHFGNRRIRQVGELIQNQLRTGLSRMERVVRERMTTQDAEAITPQSLINIRPVNATIKEFFGTSQLSQFMDQNNPLAGVTNKRRLSALGPGGLSRDRASMEVRDVHPSHFGRMCPIESPEGPNIGLIGSLATFGRINPFGFIETPYRKVDNGQLTDEITYMTADQEADHVIAQANQIIDDKGHLVESTALVRDSEGEAEDVPVDQVDYMDVSPRQMVSLGASLIPFLEHDEGHRALMGTNMQRQAVPLIKSERPLVGTGSEWRAAVDSGDVILADKPGVVTYVSGDIIRVLNDDGTQSSYKLSKFQRSNQTTCYNQVPTIKDGERVEAGSVLADGPATQNGEMALGKNLLVAFMPWNGYNYEDAVIISQRLVQDDTLSSIHIEEYEIDARETKLGSEEITRDLPNVGEDAVANLDERGVIRIGAEVEAGDILVGKVTPKGETELTPEERLLRAIFGEKSREVRDTSLRVPHGETGTVIAVKEISREDAEEDGDELPNGVNQMIRVYIAQHRKITQGDKLSGRHGNKGVISRILPEEDMPFLPDGTPIDIMLNPLGVPSRMNLGQVLELHLGWIAHAGWDINIDPDLEAEWKKHIPAGAEKADPDTPVASPVFDGVRQDALHGLLKTTLPNRDGEHLVGDHGKAVLYDGRTGEPFTKPISVGYMYMLKLHHLVDDKIHARSTGPYSMITQQPLGGKAQFGGQRFGEMEVWALEAYGAAYTLHEMMTTKSDDVDGRVRVYGAIVKGDNLPPAGIPESFKVLLKEMQSLSLNVEVLNAEGVAIDMKDEDDDPASASNDLGFNIGARPDAGAAMSSNDSEPEYR
ncbi:DNA-directed RNA polymerase subunit beta [Bifidobacterium crudilactis]|uniref:DNA-directed RNA polymerase subunit beta n=5 Tax=Bifidobacterium crudilactis TaxID=327277 RepID=A0A971IC99_9BIFI|nr:DNA-directed RNA polymerase subunit beta [Bifidobacterium crudilactis]MCI1217355.1 DNA-directed RNA polymerase subunit beta [Bifidobacterium crudilactis]MCI1664521.1 DNA-directed RNA polymerase subunit beta [Bifidobacterium crudilactis]MCI1869191.1 DNA-directed RNA polymerase subunit beta [Bifidobacterium crudilactis]MCI2148475.1 DNA-directed RNA polymerase subunit beta [Bifidobacterium crudilactis]MCI2157112.1 DNA-directed RNA polymerase subunit beta [Bifidobacterium crudilactis]